ncbi:WD40 repeat-like protein, partial [Suillus hirtellus]
SRDHTLRIWDVDKGTSILVGVSFEGHESCMRPVAISPDGKRMIKPSSSGTSRLGTKQKIFSPLVKHTSQVRLVCFSDCWRLATSRSNNFKFVIWDAETGAVVSILHGHNYGIRSVVWSPDGQQLLFTSNNANDIFWHSSHGYWIDHPCTGHSDTIYYSLAISSDSTFIITASADNIIRMWN